MNGVTLTFKYVTWHYTRGLRDCSVLTIGFLRGIAHFFSLITLLKTLFVPWRKLTETYRGGFDPESFFSSLVVNTLMRLVGFFVRSIVIVIGVIALIAAFFVGVALILLWLALPFIVLAFAYVVLIRFIHLFV